MFTLSLDGGADVTTRVTAEIVPLKTGCELRLTHENVPPELARHTEGRWSGMLYGLATVLERRGS